MKAIKFIDSAGNIDFVIGDLSTLDRSLVKASIGNIPYDGTISSMFFKDYSTLQIYLEQNPNKLLIGKGCLSSHLNYGNSKDNHVYHITNV